jgi:hypothetical protein
MSLSDLRQRRVEITDGSAIELRALRYADVRTIILRYQSDGVLGKNVGHLPLKTVPPSSSIPDAASDLMAFTHHHRCQYA